MSTSIQSYPLDHVELETYIASHVGGDYIINDILLMPVVVLVTTIIGIILCITMSNKIIAGVIPLICGIVGAWAYLTKDALHLGTNWGLHLVVCIAMIVAAALRMFFQYKSAQASRMESAK